VISGDSVTANGDTYAFSTANAGNGLTVTESGAALTNNNYQLGTVGTTTANINAKTLTATITANDKTYDKSTAATGAMTLNGVISGDSVTANGDTYAFSTANAGNGLTVTESGATLTNSNYQLGTVGTTTANINPATLTYTADPVTWINGIGNPSFTGSVTGFVSDEFLTSATTGTAIFTTLARSTSDVGTYPILGSGLSANNGNYIFKQAATNSSALVITPAALSFVIGNVLRLQGQPDPAFAATYKGPAYDGLNIPALLAGLSYQTTASSSSPAGRYAITASASVPPGLVINIVPGSLTVIENSPRTIPSQVIDSNAVAPLLPIATTPAVNGFVQPLNSFGMFQITVPALNQNLRIASGVGFETEQRPLAQTLFFGAPGDTSTSYSSGAKVK
jgi:hypothetical protein